MPRIYLQELHTSNTSQSDVLSPHIMHLLRSAFLNASAPTVEATRASFQPFEAVLPHRASTEVHVFYALYQSGHCSKFFKCHIFLFGHVT